MKRQPQPVLFCIGKADSLWAPQALQSLANAETWNDTDVGMESPAWVGS